MRQKIAPDAWTTFNTISMLGGALLGQKKYADAEPLLRQGYEGLRRASVRKPDVDDEKARRADAATLAIQKQRLAEALDRLIELATATNRPADMKKW